VFVPHVFTLSRVTKGGCAWSKLPIIRCGQHSTMNGSQKFYRRNVAVKSVTKLSFFSVHLAIELQCSNVQLCISVLDNLFKSDSRPVKFLGALTNLVSQNSHEIVLNCRQVLTTSINCAYNFKCCELQR
jgi:hypothetical protein